MVVTRLKKIKEATSNEDIKTLMQGINVLIENMGSSVDETEYDWNIVTKYADRIEDGPMVLIELSKEEYEEEKAFLKGKTYVKIDFSAIQGSSEPLVFKKTNGMERVVKQLIPTMGLPSSVKVELFGYDLTPIMNVIVTDSLDLFFAPDEFYENPGAKHYGIVMTSNMG